MKYIILFLLVISITVNVILFIDNKNLKVKADKWDELVIIVSLEVVGYFSEEEF